MSCTDKQQIISYLLQHGVSRSMISILEEQRINEEDLQTMDRDDIEHLFKNEYGFTFADRKRFWMTVQKAQTITKNVEVVCTAQQDEMPDIYEIIDDSPSDYQLTPPQYVSLSAQSSLGSKITSPTPNYNDFSIDTNQDILDKASSSDHVDALSCPKLPLPVREVTATRRQTKASAKTIFEYPVRLPVFSSKVMQALQTNKIEDEWYTLIKELVKWVLSITWKLPRKNEYQAIGHTLFRQYPCIARDGYRPWSYLCRCLTTSLSRERQRLGVTRVRKIN